MNVNITHEFEKAALAARKWTHEHVRHILEALTTEHPGARVSWEAGDEEWARVLSPEGGETIALVCAKIPLAFFRGGIAPRAYVGDLVWITVAIGLRVLV